MRETEKILSEIKEKAPDLSKKISDGVDWNVVKTSAEKDKKKFNFGGFKNRFALVSACLLVLFAIVALPLILHVSAPVETIAEGYDIVLDVNPRIKLSVDEKDKVVSQCALNEDGVVFLYGKNFVGNTADEAVQNIMKEMQKLGLLKDNFVRISALSHKTKEINEEKQSHTEKIINSLFDVNTVFLSDDELDKIEDYYEKHGVSEKEKTLISELMEKVVKLIGEKISDINALAEKLGGYSKKSDEIIPSFPDDLREEISRFCAKYGTKLEFDVNGEIKYKHIRDLKKDLEEQKEELEEGLEDIDEASDDGDFGELMEELVELVKEEIFASED